jgi:hypothetical protein
MIQVDELIERMEYMQTHDFMRSLLIVLWNL